jgi:hypothetical protein
MMMMMMMTAVMNNILRRDMATVVENDVKHQRTKDKGLLNWKDNLFLN